jgi:hypothetical protein
LQAAFFRRLQQVWQYNAIVSEPWSQLVDLTLPLAITFAPVVAFLVHTEHLSKAHNLRRRYLMNALAALGRIVFLVTPPRGSRGLRRVWLLVFESRRVRDHLMQVRVQDESPWILAPSD